MANEQLAGGGLGHVALGNLEHFGTAGAVDAYDLHATANPPWNKPVSGDH